MDILCNLRKEQQLRCGDKSYICDIDLCRDILTFNIDLLA